MKLVDSHAHLDSEQFEKDIKEVIERALKGGVEYILTIGDVSNEASINKTLDLSEKYDSIYFALGLHPHQANEFKEEHEERILRFSKNRKMIAIGEIGLDFFYNFSPQEKQIKIFERQLEIAENLALPVVIHSRKAGDKIYEIIKKRNFKRGGVLHCFTESEEVAKKMLEFGFYISVSGIITFQKAENLRGIIRNLSIENLLIETDCPYLAPVPYRGKRNEPVYVIETARKLAEIKEMELEKISEITTQNFLKLFKINT